MKKTLLIVSALALSACDANSIGQPPVDSAAATNCDNETSADNEEAAVCPEENSLGNE